MNNPCVRCGKQRRTSRQWKEKVETLAGISVVTYTETVCPDPVCQSIVEAKQAELREKALERATLKAARTAIGKKPVLK